jgi:hypothetical protein
MADMTRRILMVEIASPDAETAERLICEALPDAVVWGEVDGVDAALLVLNAQLAPAAR